VRLAVYSYGVGGCGARRWREDGERVGHGVAVGADGRGLGVICGWCGGGTGRGDEDWIWQRGAGGRPCYL
jgi:hypothetical protein